MAIHQTVWYGVKIIPKLLYGILQYIFFQLFLLHMPPIY